MKTHWSEAMILGVARSFMGGLHTNNMKLWGNLYTFPNCSPPTYSH